MGSSKKMISGSRAVARARATRFCMRRSAPTDRARHLGPRPTAPSLAIATSRAWTGAMPSLWTGPKATFSQTRSESNSAPPWNSMPNLRMTSARPPSASATVSWSSILIEPASGRIRPRMHFSSTDLPVPEPPITTIDSPWATSRSMPAGPSWVRRFRDAAEGDLRGLSARRGFRDEVVEGQDPPRPRPPRWSSPCRRPGRRPWTL